MNALAGALTLLSALAYLFFMWTIVRKRPQTFAGARALNVAAVVFFAASRVLAQSEGLAMVTSLAIAAALIAITRRSNLLGGVLAGAPLVAMLFTVDRTFFSDAVNAQFQDATIAALCVPGPFAAAVWLTSLLRRRSNYPTTSGP